MKTYMIQNIEKVNIEHNVLYHMQDQGTDIIDFYKLSAAEDELGLASYFFIFAAARRTASSLTFPVLSLIVPSVAFGENWGMGFERFLFSVSLRFC